MVPRYVSAHRLAAITLYRSLLQQCRRAPAALVEHRDELQSIVRNRFRQAQHVHSYRRLRLAFQAGYEAIDHLDAAVAGDEKSTAYLLDLVQRAPAKVKVAPPLPQPKRKPKAATKNVQREGALERELSARPRPLEDLSGRRRVPVLFSANKIPVLRFTKPQPHALSRYIANRILQRHKRFDRRDYLQDQMGIAQAEDEWDALVSSDGGESEGLSLEDAMRGGVVKQERKSEEPAWTEEFETALGVVEAAVREEGRKNMEMAGRMQELVDREREAFERERDERRTEARQGRKERSRLRKAAAEQADAVVGEEARV